MISFLPDKSEVLPDGELRFVASEGTSLLGKCTFIPMGDRALITSLEADRLSLAAEGLIRAVLSCAAGKGAYIALVSPEVPGEDFIRLGFSNKNGVLCAEIPDVLLGGCADNRQER